MDLQELYTLTLGELKAFVLWGKKKKKRQLINDHCTLKLPETLLRELHQQKLSALLAVVLATSGDGKWTTSKQETGSTPVYALLFWKSNTQRLFHGLFKTIDRSCTSKQQ